LEPQAAQDLLQKADQLDQEEITTKSEEQPDGTDCGDNWLTGRKQSTLSLIKPSPFSDYRTEANNEQEVHGWSSGDEDETKKQKTDPSHDDGSTMTSLFRAIRDAMYPNN